MAQTRLGDRVIRAGRSVLVALLVVAAGVCSTAHEAAADPIDSCSTGTGVVVVVDFSHWGRPLIRGCDATPTTGLDALPAAGFTTEGTVRDGPAFVCRINGYPSVAQDACRSTPPASASWSYWHADPGQQSWTYSPLGAASYHPPDGSVDAWVFGATDGGGTVGGPAFSPAGVRAQLSKSATRISVSPSVLTAGQSVTVGVRVVSGGTGIGLVAVPVELWQQVGAGAWALAARLVATDSGLVTTVRRPSTTVLYQARFPSSRGYAANQSSTARVVVRRSSATRVSLDRTVTTAALPVHVGARVVDGTTGAGLRGVPVQLWQRFDGGRWVRAAQLATDSGGLVVVSRRPSVSINYQMRFLGTDGYAPSVSITRRLAVSGG